MLEEFPHHDLFAEPLESIFGTQYNGGNQQLTFMNSNLFFESVLITFTATARPKD